MWSTRSLRMPSTWMVVTKEFMESHGLWVMLLSTIAMGQLLGTILGSFYTISSMSLDREITIEFISWTAQPHPATTTTSAPLAAWWHYSPSTTPLWSSYPWSWTWSEARIFQHEASQCFSEIKIWHEYPRTTFTLATMWAMYTTSGSHSFCCTLCSVMATLTNNTILLSGRAMVTAQASRQNLKCTGVSMLCLLRLYAAYTYLWVLSQAKTINKK